ncbi:hypothetical protein BHM03_00053676 [Ensete ventricosum]|nr:hypothetical protein BHM03_00053676 [Ensete ventricosum]
MHRIDAVGNSLGVCRELAEGIGSLLGWHKGVRQKKPRVIGRLSGVAEKLIGSSDDAVRSHRSSLGDSPKGSGSSLGTR